jgi:hypothetical protein
MTHTSIDKVMARARIGLNQDSVMSVLLTTWMALLRYEVKRPMLPPFIIEQIRKRESEERTRPVQPHLELPLIPHRPPNQDGASPPHDEENKRGVIILDL